MMSQEAQSETSNSVSVGTTSIMQEQRARLPGSNFSLRTLIALTMNKINPETRWTKNQLVEYDADDKDPIKFDLCGALAHTLLDLNKQLPKRRIEDVIVGLTADDDLQSMFNIFVQLYEEVFGEILNKGRPVKSTFSQVKIGIVNDSSTHDNLMKKLQVMVEYLK